MVTPFKWGDLPEETPVMAMKTIVALPGQGIGPEVVDATCGS